MRYLPPRIGQAKLPNICVIGKYPDSNLDLVFRIFFSETDMPPLARGSTEEARA